MRSNARGSSWPSAGRGLAAAAAGCALALGLGACAGGSGPAGAALVVVPTQPIAQHLHYPDRRVLALEEMPAATPAD